MRPIKTNKTNQELQPPGDWDHKKEKCNTLPIIREKDKMSSVWKLSIEELDAINKGAPVLLTVWGTEHPPVAINVIKPGESDYDEVK